MSFNELLSDGSYTPKKKEIVIEHNGKSLRFTVHALPYFEVFSAAVHEHLGKNIFAYQTHLAVTDEEGKRMSYEQALNLSDEHAKIFWEAVTEVNKREDEEKN